MKKGAAIISILTVLAMALCGCGRGIDPKGTTEISTEADSGVETDEPTHISVRASKIGAEWRAIADREIMICEVDSNIGLSISSSLSGYYITDENAIGQVIQVVGRMEPHLNVSEDQDGTERVSNAFASRIGGLNFYDEHRNTRICLDIYSDFVKIGTIDGKTSTTVFFDADTDLTAFGEEIQSIFDQYGNVGSGPFYFNQKIVL